MKVRYVILFLLLLALVAGGVFVWRIYQNLDSYVASAIRDSGSEVLGTRVGVSGVSIDLRAGKASISGLTVANPEGFSKRNVIELKGIDVELELASLTRDVIVLESIRINEPAVLYEMNAERDTNVAALQRNAESGGSAAEGEGDDVLLIIDRLVLEGGTVRAESALTPDRSLDIALPTISMRDIGRAQGGATPDEVATVVAARLTDTVIDAAVKAGVDSVIEEQKDKLREKARDKFKDLLKRD